LEHIPRKLVEELSKESSDLWKTGRVAGVVLVQRIGDIVRNTSNSLEVVADGFRRRSLRERDGAQLAQRLGFDLAMRSRVTANDWPTLERMLAASSRQNAS